MVGVAIQGAVPLRAGQDAVVGRRLATQAAVRGEAALHVPGEARPLARLVIAVDEVVLRPNARLGKVSRLYYHFPSH